MQHAIKTTLISIAHLVREEMNASTVELINQKQKQLRGTFGACNGVVQSHLPHQKNTLRDFRMQFIRIR